MMEWKIHFEKAISFIKEYQSLVDCHLVDFITENLWHRCLSNSLRFELECHETSEQGREYNLKDLRETSLELDSFFNEAEKLSLKHNPIITSLNDFCSIPSEAECINENCKKEKMNFMSDKKKHETEALAILVAHLAEKNSISLVIDAGAGKGYLSTNISQKYGIPVLGIDSSENNIRGAIHRQGMILKKNRKKNLDNNALVHYSVQYIDEGTDYNELIRLQFAERNISNNYILSGLHTCGQLAHTMIKQFLRNPCLKCICVVPCCYHLTEESLTSGCNLSKNARMIAQQSVERSESKNSDDAHPPSLFYRTLLQVLLQSLGIPNAKIGRGAPTKDFPTYAQWALEKVGVESEKIPSIEALIKLYQTYSSLHWKFNIFHSMRIHLGSVVEAAIVLDRVVFIQASNICSEVALIRLFDPLISPRCYAIVALK
ncbi:methyltransferase-like protein 25 [Venturia canescens]|uniref:methyltransferase-like protein 25 n=1 Tax=Venturia canescens TaxID=32260 RepID=UPI001C9BFD78|nr:methyltransferase-like protein 25 [Venturia canescens]